MQETLKRTRSSVLDLPLASLLNVNIEMLMWGGLIVFTALTRFWDLGSRSYNHDESLHALYSWYLYQGRGYVHDPMMHGPFQFHINALLFFLFGDSDYTGRILPAIFGVIAVVLPFGLRKYLGRVGALLAAVGIAISPDILYYSRFARNDIYHAVWSMLAIIGLFGFITTRKGRYFILGAVALSLMWATKEVVYIFGFSGFTFLAIVLVIELLRKGNFGLLEAVRSLDLATVLIGVSAALAIFVILYTTFFTNLAGLYTGAVGAIQYWLAQQDVARGGQPWYYYLIIVPLYDFMPVTASLLGIGYYALRRNTASLSFAVASALTVAMAIAMWGRPAPEANSPFNTIGPIVVALLAVVSLTFAIRPFASPMLQGMMGQRVRAEPANIPNTIIFGIGAIGFALAAIEWGSNLTMPALANTLVFILLLGWTVVSLTVAALRGRGDYPLFTAFCIHWLLTSFMVYSWAGEKMPWLTLHMSLPSIILGAMFVADLWKRVDWASVRERGGLWLGLLIPLIGYALLRILMVAPFQGISIQKIDATLQWVASLAVGILLVYLAYRLAKKLNRGEIVQVGFAALLVVMAAFTLRAAFMAAFEFGDVAVEMLIYAQGAPDVPVVAREIDALSQKLTGGTDMDIVVESSETWPFAWYLRDYKKVAYPASLDGPPTAPVVIAGYENFDKYKPWMTNYIGVKEKLIWWFAEDYKGGVDPKSGQYVTMNFETIITDLTDAKHRESLLNFLFYRKFETPLGQWPLRKEFTFYVRKDLANLVWTPAQLPPAAVDQVDKEFQSKIVNATAKTSIGLKGDGDGQFNTPKGVSVATDGSIYVADAGNNRIDKFDPTGRFVMSIGTAGSNDGQFQEPWAVAVAADGTIFAADTWNHRIEKFDASGKFLQAWGTFGDTTAQAPGDKTALLYGPRAIAIDADGNLWVVDTGNKRVVKFSPSGQVLGSFGSLGTSAGQFAEPVGIAISAKTGDIFIADTWNHRVQRFTKDFAPALQWNVIGWESTSVVNKPYLALDASDNVYVTDPENHRILKYANDGTLLAVLGKPGVDLSSFNLPTGIAIDAQGSIIISDSLNNRLLKFDPLSK
jgi:uncharacterized protein (TIGR03663 family)